MNFKVFLLFGVLIECVICWGTARNPGSEYVDPSDMGSYSHGARRNVRANAQIHAQRNDGTVGTVVEPDNLEAVSPEAVSLKLRELSGGVSSPCTCPCPSLDETSVMLYTKRIIASLLTQMNVRSHVFGPGEAITMDLHAEISYEDFKTLNNFLGAKDGESEKYIRNVDLIISQLLHVVTPHHSSGAIDDLVEFLTLHKPTLLSFKFWLLFFSVTVVGFITLMVFVQIARARNQPVIFIGYALLLIFILSCLYTFAGLQEKSKAVNSARLHQYDSIPRDCDYNNLGVRESFVYFWRVKVMGYPDQCEEYHKELLMDPFHRASPVEAISETFSKLIFHPFGYVGERLGMFVSRLIYFVPFWIQPFLLTLIFVFGFLGLFRYRIRTLFVSIEPVARPRIESPRHAFRDDQAIIERPPAPIVPMATRDASTSTDDLEEYILQQERGDASGQGGRRNSRFIEPTPRSLSNWAYIRDITICGLISLYTNILQVLSKILRETPSIVVDNNDDIVDQIWERNVIEEPPLPILPEQEVIYPQVQIDEGVEVGELPEAKEQKVKPGPSNPNGQFEEERNVPDRPGDKDEDEQKENQIPSLHKPIVVGEEKIIFNRAGGSGDGPRTC